ncbi:MAG: ABC transporter substrate-binding protein [Reyranella sp.]|nr:ABC transporter substrate-binding protein [Reyranella sp.]
MKRREATRLLGGAVALLPLAAQAQQPAMPIIGFLNSASPEQNVGRLAAFRNSLAAAGYVDGKNVTIDFQWAAGQNARLPALAADLVAKRVAVIVTLSSTPAAVAAKAATDTIPIYFVIADPPVQLGLVASLNRPGGNATGIVNLSVELVPKRLELLREIAPQAAVLAVLIHSNHPSAKAMADAVQASAQVLGMRAQVLQAATDEEIDAAYASIKPGTALLVATDASFFVRRAQFAALSLKQAVPTMFDNSDAVAVGGLLSYGANAESLWERAGANVARILKGEKPADLPVEQATKFDLAINLKTAKVLGLAVSPKLLAMANDVIE